MPTVMHPGLDINRRFGLVYVTSIIVETKMRVKIGVSQLDPHFFREIYPCSSSL